MTASINKTFLMGHIGRDPEIIKVAPDVEIIKFGLATNEYWKDKNTGEKKEDTQWHDIVIKNPHLIEWCKKILRKGMYVMIEGSIKNVKWKDKEGKSHKTTEILVGWRDHHIHILQSVTQQDAIKEGQKSGSSGYPGFSGPTSKLPQPTYQDDDLDDLPF